MSKNLTWITTDNAAIYFEDTEVGRMKKELWDASEEEIDAILREYEVPSLPELGKPGCYIQTTPRQRVNKASPPQAAGYLQVLAYECSTPQAAGNPPRRD